MSTTDNSTIFTGNGTASVDRPLTQEEKNAEADNLLIWMIVPTTAVFLGIGAAFFIRKRFKAYRARKANNSNDIELQQRANSRREEPEPASPDVAPGLFYLNQDHTAGIETPPPAYSATSIVNSLKGS